MDKATKILLTILLALTLSACKTLDTFKDEKNRDGIKNILYITDQTGSGASRTIQIELEKNVTGAVNVTLTASDGNGGSSSKSFAITIQANSNNAPVVNFSSEINQINDELDQIYYPFSLAVSDPDGDSVSIKLEQLDGFSWVNLALFLNSL